MYCLTIDREKKLASLRFFCIILTNYTVNFNTYVWFGFLKHKQTFKTTL